MSTSLRRQLALVAVALWFGGALLMATTVAPAAFDVLPTRTLAGALVGRVLPVLFFAGVAVGVLAAMLVFPWSRVAAACAGVTGAACAFAQFVIGARIARLREAIGPVLDAVDPSDPRRVEFGRLHGVSVALLGVALLAAFVFLILALRAHGARSGEP